MDAIEAIYRSLSQKGSSRWVLDADIAKCFDKSITRRFLCVGHVRQFGGESPLCNLMEVKH